MRDFKTPRQQDSFRLLLLALILGLLCFLPAFDAWVATWSMP